MRQPTLKLCVVVAVCAILPALVRADGAKTDAEFRIALPPGIPAEVWDYYIPRDNPLTAAKVELGRQLFFDKMLSADSSVSCATCHDPKFAFADGRPVAVGIGGRQGRRNSPSLLNAMFNSGQFWDGRAGSLEEQAKLPLINPDEMGVQTHAQVEARVAASPEYARQFRQVFGGPVTIDYIAKAIAAFERTLVSADSPFDRFQAGDFKALSESARNGFMLFRSKARCTICHSFNPSFPFLSDQNYRNTGVAANFVGFNSLVNRAMQLTEADLGEVAKVFSKDRGAPELGRFLVTGNALDIGAFRTASLRNVELTAPYFHDGSAATLADVVKFYVKGGNENPVRDWQLEPVPLTESEQRDLVEFLKSLTSDTARRMAQAEQARQR